MVHTESAHDQTEAVVEKPLDHSGFLPNDVVLTSYLWFCQLALIRNPASDEVRRKPIHRRGRTSTIETLSIEGSCRQL